MLEKKGKMQIAKCKSQNDENDSITFVHASILQFEIYNLHFALAADEGRAI